VKSSVAERDPGSGAFFILDPDIGKVFLDPGSPTHICVSLARFLDWEELLQKSQFVSPDREE
jgi:hypothetical protein